MIPAENRRFVLKSRPQLLAGPENFRLEACSIPDLEPGQALAKIEMAALSAWQGMRTKDFRNFIRPFAIGELISCDTFSRIIASECEELPVGCAVVGRQGWQEFAVVSKRDAATVRSDFSAEEWLTALSSPGQTPYLAFSQKARPMPGETLVVTSAAGAVGGYAVQLGRLSGMKVIGIAGGPQKARFVRESLGAHVALDYKSSDFRQELASACEGGVHIFFDAVGGDTADAVIGHLAKRAHVLLVGRVAANNSESPESDMANMRHAWSQEATIHAFNRYAYKELYAYANERLGELLRAGKLKMHNSLVDGMERTPEALNGLLAGKYFGKVLVRYGEFSAA
ncbi:MAG: NADP-dependent oxidoreductase [Albidovulum sp.]|nr:NADP-dependent oxidoreductase [Albidovulum sp.]